MINSLSNLWCSFSNLRRSGRLLTVISICLSFLYPILLPQPIVAQFCEPWPPFFFDLTPSYQDGQINYELNLFTRVNYPMIDMEIQVPIPEGTRLIRTESNPDVVVEFDGNRVKFKKLFIGDEEYIYDASFIVEPISDTVKTFVTQPQLTWTGEQGNYYQAEPVTFSIDPKPPVWSPPLLSHLRMDIKAEVFNNRIVYTLYPENIHWNVLHEVELNLPVPPGTQVESTVAVQPFSAAILNNEISFRAEAFQPNQTIPLTFTLKTSSDTPFPVTTKIWAKWGNPDTTYDLPEQSWLRSDLTIMNNQPHEIIFDTVGDVPSPSTDLISAELADLPDRFELRLTTLAPFSTTTSPSAPFIFSFDKDQKGFEGDPCDPNAQPTSFITNPYGGEFEVEYYPEQNGTRIYRWDSQVGYWDYESSKILNLNVVTKTNGAIISIPKQNLPLEPPYRWYVTSDFRQNWPMDFIPDDSENLELNTIGTFPTQTTTDMTTTTTITTSTIN